MSDEAGRERAEQLDYKARLAAHPSRPLIVPALIAINVAVYALLGAQGAGWLTADPKTLIAWGSNFAPLTTGGEWWRLLTATFLHGGLVHLLVNMYALFDTGRLCEQLYDRRRFLALYLGSGLAGSAASVWWNPLVNSVGASGAIFGVFGALLVFMLDRRNGVPPSVMKSHGASTGVFIAYALLNGMGKSGIDNAAHIGGLLGGVVLGWAFARRVGDTAPTSRRLIRPAVGMALVGAVVAVLLTLTPTTKGGYEMQQRFASDLQWFEHEERALLDDTKALLERAKKKDAKETDFRPKFAQIAGRWGGAHDRLGAYRLDPVVSRRDMIEMQNDLVEYTDLRRRAMTVLVAMIDAPDKSPEERAHQQEFLRLWNEGGVVAQRIQARTKALVPDKK